MGQIVEEETSNNGQKNTQKPEAKANKGFKEGLRAIQWKHL